MSIKLEFPILDAAGKNYLDWSQDIQNHLDAQGLLDVIYDGDDREVEVTREMNAKAMILFRRHLSDTMKSEFIAITSPKALWDALKERFDHQKTIWLPEARQDWLNLRFQDFTTVTEYNAEVCRIRSLLHYCGENLTDNDLLEKTYTTFPSSDNLLQKQYRQSKFQTFPELITQLLLDEKNSIVLMRNNNSRPVGTKAIPMPDANVVRGPHPRQGKRDKGQSSRRPVNRGEPKTRHAKRGSENHPYRRPVAPKQSHARNNNNRVSRPKERDDANDKTLCYKCGGYGMHCGAVDCLVDSGSTHTILKNKCYFINFTPKVTSLSTISGTSTLVEGFGKAQFMLSNGTVLTISEALYSPKSRRTLVCFKDIRENKFHIETATENGIEYLYITSNQYDQKRILEKLRCLSSGLYVTTIQNIESNLIIRRTPIDESTYMLWHDRLGHPGQNTMLRTMNASHGHPLGGKNFVINPKSLCQACSIGKTHLKPLHVKPTKVVSQFLERIQGDICGPIQPTCGPFKYFMVLVDASTRWSHVALLSTRNAAFPKLLAQIIKLRAHHPDYPIKSIRLDNAAEFTSKTFDDYCMTLGIDVEHPVAYVHSQNGLAEALIKRLQIIARTLVMRTKLPISAWGYAILHAATLVRLRPIATQPFSAYQLVTGYEPDVSHLRVFGCLVNVPIEPPKRSKFGPQKRRGIYVGYESPSIIRYLEPLTGDLFTARHADCDFDETIFPSLGGDLHVDVDKERRELTWHTPTLSHTDPPTAHSDKEVQRILSLQNVANQLPDAFNDLANVTRSHIPAANVPARIDVPVRRHVPVEHVAPNVPTVQRTLPSAVQSTALPKKRGRPVGSKDVLPRKRRNLVASVLPHEIIKDHGDVLEERVPEETSISHHPDNLEIYVEYASLDDILKRNETVIDDVFIFAVATDIMSNDDMEPRTIVECQRRTDWPQWKQAIQDELDSLTKRRVFGPVAPTPPNVKPIGNKWVFVRKRNENNEIVRYKARLVAQGFSQRPGIDYEETYSPVMDFPKKLNMQLMDVVTAYLYGDLDTEIYMRVPDGLKLPESSSSQPRNTFSIRLRRSLYGLKQSGRMWYNHLSEYLIGLGYLNNELCPCVFIKKSTSGYAIIAVYVDDMNLIGTSKELLETAEILKKEFEMKDLGKTRYCLGLQIEHRKDGILIHQENYTQKVLRRFSHHDAKPSSTPMIVRSLDIKKDPFRPKEDDEEILSPECSYLGAIGALLYLAQCTRPDISFAVNCLARHSNAPTRRHWNGIKDIFRYLKGTTDMGLFYPYASSSEDTAIGTSKNATLVGYADAGYLSDPHKGRSQSGYVFTIGNTAISWRSRKQTLVATSTNHSELLALYEATRECVWLRAVIGHIRSTCDLAHDPDEPIVIYEDNAAVIDQAKHGYIKGDTTKHISPKLFFTHEQQTLQKIEVQHIGSEKNHADLFTKSLPKYSFQKHVKAIGLRKLSELP
ncbi:hypothetical protein OSB04_026537 [Centaurea solstitialis]|uniref:Integrase catalytic domain-containing protein n=1 Tax=Centaurea solstitialis TaxID=347529 RepID=A0AA38SQA9_9ASTR|nr:hypothetical protein OSB04_026537 [Centaurea solstitialis]